MVTLVILGALATFGGCLGTGIWIGLGLAEDRAQRAYCDRLQERARTRLVAPRPTLLLEAPGGPARLPGYAGPFPRPGRYDPGGLMFLSYAGAMMNVPHAGIPRPAPSPVDLEADVRRLCDDTELYVAALIASSRHAERNHPW